MGVFTLTFSICFVLGPIAGSLAYTHIGPRLMWLYTGGLGIMVWFGFFWINQYLKYVNSKGNKVAIITE